MPEWQPQDPSGKNPSGGSTCKNPTPLRPERGVGQHARMVGQHKSERRVNMVQNLHRRCFLKSEPLMGAITALPRSAKAGPKADTCSPVHRESIPLTVSVKS